MGWDPKNPVFQFVPISNTQCLFWNKCPLNLEKAQHVENAPVRKSYAKSILNQDFIGRELPILEKMYWILLIEVLQGVPKNMGIQWRIRYRLCYELAL